MTIADTMHVSFTTAPCDSADPALFFPYDPDTDEPSTNPDDYQQALAMCAECTCQMTCKKRWEALGRPRAGVWFGTTPMIRKGRKLGTGWTYERCQLDECDKLIDRTTGRYKYCSDGCSETARRRTKAEYERRIRRDPRPRKRRAGAGIAGAPRAGAREVTTNGQRAALALADPLADQVVAGLQLMLRDLAGHVLERPGHRCRWCGDHLHPDSTEIHCSIRCEIASEEHHERRQQALEQQSETIPYTETEPLAS